MLGVMIPVLPFERFTLASPHRADVLVKRLRTQTGAMAARVLDEAGSRFSGVASADGFRLVANTSNRNSFKPMARGVWSPDGQGSRVDVTLTLPTPTLVFMLVWCTLILAMTGMTIFQPSSGKPQPEFWMLMPLGLLLFGYALTILAFWEGAARTRLELKKIIETAP